MTDHPLTDEMCEDLSGWDFYGCPKAEAEWNRQDMRAAYNLALNHIEALVDDKLTELYKDAHSTAESIDFFFDEVLEELRPQQEND